MRTRTTTNFILFSFATAALMTACHGGGSNDFKTDEATGVMYRFVNHDENGAKPTETSFAHIQMVWKGKNVKGDADSTYLDSRKSHGDSVGALTIPLKKTFNGSLEQAILMMAKGDSAVFQINTDSLFLKTFHYPPDRVPAFAKTNPTCTFQIKLLGFQTQQEMMAVRQAAMQKRAQEAQILKVQEPIAITNYLKKNNMDVKPDADSIFYLHVIKGKGKQVKDGDSIFVGYTLRSLDGNILEQSDHGPGSRTLNMLYSKNMSLIKGWISVLGKMHEGDKVTVLIPSGMAYGATGSQRIQPYTPLIFDMEMVRIQSNK